MSPLRQSHHTENFTNRKEIPTVNAPRRLFARLTAAAALALSLVVLSPAMAGAATPAPSWAIATTSTPTNFDPANSALTYDPNSYVIEARNMGAAEINGPVTVTDSLPAGVTLNTTNPWLFSSLRAYSDYEFNSANCEVKAPGIVCEFSNVIVKPGQTIHMIFPVSVEPSLLGTTVTNEVTISGGGAPDATATGQTQITHEPASSGFQSAETWFTDAAGAAETRAGAHPANLHVGFQENHIFGLTPGIEFAAVAPPKTPKLAITRLPRGVVVNPQATPVRCTEAQLEGNGCPDASAVGVAHTFVGILGFTAQMDSEPVYNMVPQPGEAASLAFEPFELNIFIHLRGGVDTAGDYSLTARSGEIPQYGLTTGAGFEFWGSPSDSSHNNRRGNCGYGFGASGSCPVAANETPFITMPSACSGPLTTTVSISSWEEPDSFISTDIPSTDTGGNPVGITGCNALEFEPTLTARPTTNVADSASGLEVDLHIPQDENVNTLAHANLKNTTVTLPEGVTVNPASANGLAACSAAQIGLTSAPGVTPVRTTADPAACPVASKLGSVEVDTPLVDHPLLGSVYIAKPYENPFSSLLALYIAVHDQKTGVVLKLAGKVTADPQTGQLVATFEENPELPFEDFKLDFFGGAGGALRTPPTCGAYATTSSLEPWSAPDSGPPAETEDGWAIEQAPGGGACPASVSQQPYSPSLDAGSLSPVAGAATPTVVNLRRQDGTQEFSSVTLTLPPGLTGKLAGVGYCADSALAAAAAKSGREEEASPSCPSASRIGRVDVAVGAGPAPYNTQGTAYLTGPYKGGPLGMAIVTPATAGPFDLGTVVVRVALHVDPVTGQITAISDSLPRILQGIPLDIRSARVLLDRPDFTRNGTSCDPLQVTSSVLSVLGRASSLSQRFQLGECSSLGFKPKLSIRLKGGTKRGAHPALIGVAQMPAGGANIANVAVALPKSEFLDQGHIGTICTRVQFAADGCPSASIYGQATARSPLVDYPLEGPVYLRSSDHELPDLVAALHGPASQPVEVEVSARIDSPTSGPLKGGIRSTFEAVPDLPVSSFTLRMQGGKKGLLQNSTNICKAPYRATAEFEGQNGKVADLKPMLKAKCPKAKRHKHAKRAR